MSNENFKIQLTESRSISGVGKLIADGKLEMSGMQPACTAQSIANEIVEGNILFMEYKQYEITGKKVISDNCLYVYYKDKDVEVVYKSRVNTTGPALFNKPKEQSNVESEFDKKFDKLQDMMKRAECQGGGKVILRHAYIDILPEIKKALQDKETLIKIKDNVNEQLSFTLNAIEEVVSEVFKNQPNMKHTFNGDNWIKLFNIIYDESEQILNRSDSNE